MSGIDDVLFRVSDAILDIGDSIAGTDKDTENSNQADKDIRENINKISKDIVSELSGRGNSRFKPVLNNLIGFMSSSSGAGASTLVSNVASLIKKKGLSVAVVDLNLLYPSQHLYFDIPQELSRDDLLTLLSGKSNLDSSICYSDDIAVIVANNRGIMDYVGADNKYSVENLSNALDNLAYQFDVVLVDCPLDIANGYVNTALYKLDNLYIVMDDGVQSLVNIPKIHSCFDELAIVWNKCKFIMNKRTSNYYNESNLSKVGIQLVEIIPFDLGVLTSGLRSELYIQKGIGVGKTSKDVEKAFKSLSDKVLTIGGLR